VRNFQAITRQYELKKFLDSPQGTLYFVPFAPGLPHLLVRHFDGNWSRALIGPFVDFIGTTQRWIEAHHALQSLVRIDQPLEVGCDFIARRHHYYHVSLSSYDSGKVEPPPQLASLRECLRTALTTPGEGRIAVIHTVLSRSILEPTDKTFWKSVEQRFVVVEPSMTTGELEKWARFTRPSS